MAHFNPQARERMDRLHAQQHALHALHLKIPRQLFDALRGGSEDQIATAALRADERGVDLGRVVKGRMRALLAARGKEEIAFARTRLVEITRAAFLNASAEDETTEVSR